MVLGSLTIATGYYHSAFYTGEGFQTVQPIPFSHAHHVKGLGLDCRYCHTSVENSSSAGFPDSATCFGCHSQVWNQTKMLKPVRDSVKDGSRLRWHTVNNLPDYVFFNHEIHIAKGIGCVSCHGKVSDEPVVKQARSFLMRDCLSCHLDPSQFVRPTEQIFNEEWQSQDHREESSRAFSELQVHALPSTNCNLCHR